MNFELVEAVDAENPVEGDLRLTNGQITFVEGRDAIRQHLANRLRFFRGEWFRDQRQGLPYYERVLIKSPDTNALRTLFRRAIVETPGIAVVDKLELTIASDRTASLAFEAALDSGGEPLVFEDFILGEF
jgi:hypothetical protein